MADKATDDVSRHPPYARGSHVNNNRSPYSATALFISILHPAAIIHFHYSLIIKLIEKLKLHNFASTLWTSFTDSSLNANCGNRTSLLSHTCLYLSLDLMADLFSRPPLHEDRPQLHRNFPVTFFAPDPTCLTASCYPAIMDASKCRIV